MQSGPEPVEEPDMGTNERTSRTWPLALGGGLALATAGLLPFAARQLGPTTSFVPALLSTVASFDVISVWLLTADYRDTGDRRVLAMALAYLWSLVVMSGYALSFPGVFSSHPPFAVTASVAPYLYVGWHTGFPALLALAFSPVSRLDVRDGPEGRRRLIRLSMVAGVTVPAAIVAACVANARHLPTLIQGLDTSGMVRVTAPWSLPLVAGSLVVCWRGVRSRRGPERWAMGAILVCLCDLVLTYSSRFRFSLGWYAGRSLTVLAAGIVLIAMLAEFQRVKAVAQRQAAYDDLTGLANRRTAYDMLAAMTARAGRMDTNLSVLMFDLDHFKRVNDDYGHAIGDAVLRNVGDVLRATVRRTDLAARVGGEEFLVLLPDADESAAELVAQRLRTALANGRGLPDGSPITASFGVAAFGGDSLDPDTLVRRADHAMYRAKESGRDRIAVAIRPL
jgi:diguanylate cyclase (GGDEF)-like protein